MNIDLRQLRSFSVIAQLLSFRKASEQLHIAQPALSRQVAQLESALNCQLFDRQKRQIQLTDAGQHLFNALPAFFESLHTIASRTNAIANGKVNKLTFGFSSAAMASFLPEIIKELHTKLEGCEFNFIEKTSDMLIQSVIAGNIDAAFILHRPDNALLNTMPIKAGKVGVVLPPEHYLAQQHEIALSDLENETLILFPRDTNQQMYDDIISYCQISGFSPKQIIETAPRSTAIALVAAGQGIATIAESLKQACITGTVFKPLMQPSPMVNYSCITLKQRKGMWLEVLTEHIASKLQ